MNYVNRAVQNENAGIMCEKIAFREDILGVDSCCQYYHAQDTLRVIHKIEGLSLVILRMISQHVQKFLWKYQDKCGILYL